MPENTTVHDDLLFVMAGVVLQGASALDLVPISTDLLAVAAFLYYAGSGFVRLFVSLRPVWAP